MKNSEPAINPYLFEKQFEAFKAFIGEQSKITFVSFASNPYTFEQEGYKSDIYKEAREQLAFQSWSEPNIGQGDIISSTINAIELKSNNLVQWQSRYGDESRPHHPLFEARSSLEKTRKIELCLFNFYYGIDDVVDSFNKLVEVFGKKYALIAYLYFIKDSSKYLPIAPSYFDSAFKLLGAEFTVTKRCSWENYYQYILLIKEVKGMLIEKLSSEVSLLDAHSFVWILSSQMKKQNKQANIAEYMDLSDTERNAIVRSRVGQGQFRQSLVDYWSGCAVTGCKEVGLLVASHIKPWANSSAADRLSLYNGLLLSPNIDACFDKGFISFENTGEIIISSEFSGFDSLGIQKDMRLSRIEPEHFKYLAYHRQSILKRV